MLKDDDLHTTNTTSLTVVTHKVGRYNEQDILRRR